MRCNSFPVVPFCIQDYQEAKDWHKTAQRNQDSRLAHVCFTSKGCGTHMFFSFGLATVPDASDEGGDNTTIVVAWRHRLDHAVAKLPSTTSCRSSSSSFSWRPILIAVLRGGVGNYCNEWAIVGVVPGKVGNYDIDTTWSCSASSSSCTSASSSSVTPWSCFSPCHEHARLRTCGLRHHHDRVLSGTSLRACGPVAVEIYHLIISRASSDKVYNLPALISQRAPELEDWRKFHFSGICAFCEDSRCFSGENSSFTLAHARARRWREHD